MARQDSVRENIGRLHHAGHEQCADTVEYCRESLDLPWQDKFDLVPQSVPTPVINAGQAGLGPAMHDQCKALPSCIRVQHASMSTGYATVPYQVFYL